MTDKEKLETAAREYAKDKFPSLSVGAVHIYATAAFIAGADWHEKQMGWKKYDKENPPEPGEYLVELYDILSGGVKKQYWDTSRGWIAPIGCYITRYLPLPPSPPQGEKT